MARRLIREEGLLVGGAAGAVMSGTIKACKHLAKGQRCVVVLPDSTRNFITRFLSDAWMVKEGYAGPMNDAPRSQHTDQWWASKK